MLPQRSAELAAVYLGYDRLDFPPSPLCLDHVSDDDSQYRSVYGLWGGELVGLLARLEAFQSPRVWTRFAMTGLGHSRGEHGLANRLTGMTNCFEIEGFYEWLFIRLVGEEKPLGQSLSSASMTFLTLLRFTRSVFRRTCGDSLEA